MSRHFLTRAYSQLFRHEQWNIGIVYEPISAFLKSGVEHPVHWIPRVRGDKYLADPFGVAKGGTLYILCEEFDYRGFSSRIVGIEVTDEDTISDPGGAIELPFHTAYPYLFENQGEIYCVPETAQAREISLYKSANFPYEWKKVATLISGFGGRDGTIFRHDGCWWLACAGEGDDSFRTLFAWYSYDLFGPWTAHRANPVKSDIGSSRPAGTPFLHDGYLYRPAQDCSRTYGGRIVLNRVTRLTPTEFKEEKVAVIEPYPNGPYPDGLHTVSAVGDITLVDGKRHLFVKAAFEHAVAAALGAALRKVRARHETIPHLG